MLPCGNEIKEFISYRNGMKWSYIAFEKQIYRTNEVRISQKEEQTMNDKTIKELAVELTVETTAICDNIKGRAVFVNQLLRSCSSIGANSHEAKYAQSRADFIHKLEIALKECYETEYWLEILYKVNSLQEDVYNELNNKSGTLRRKLIASITTAKKNQSKGD